MTFAYHSGDVVTFFTYVVEFQDDRISFAAIYTGVLVEVLRKAHVQSDQNLLFARRGSRDIRRFVLLVVLSIVLALALRAPVTLIAIRFVTHRMHNRVAWSNYTVAP